MAYELDEDIKKKICDPVPEQWKQPESPCDPLPEPSILPEPYQPPVGPS